MSKKINVGILGYGVVGSGIVHILENHKSKISQVTGCDVVISKILVRDLSKQRKNFNENFFLTTNPNDILEDNEISIVAEVMGSVAIAREYVIKALKNGKHVVTANKDLIVAHGNELIEIAKENKKDLYFEASVAGGIPILRTIVTSLASDKIEKVMGIINGTTNYMLTKMKNEKKSYEEALKEAQELGFAESDPTNDVDGFDAARKLSILTKLSFGMNIPLEEIETSGIRGIESIDLKIADKLGYTIKLIGNAQEKQGTISAKVAPFFVLSKHPLANVENENNAVFIKGAAVGETMFYGPGAGSLPTANSIVGDIISVINNIKLGTTGQLFNNYIKETKKTPDNEVFSKYYIRVSTENRNSNLNDIIRILSLYNINFEEIFYDHSDNKKQNIIIVTNDINNAQINKFVADIKNSQTILMEAKYAIL